MREIGTIARAVLASGALVLLLTGQAAAQSATETAPAIPGSDSTADHTKFDILNGPFASGPEVTAACISCHTEADDQVMHSIHYQWSFENPETGQSLGKSKVINAFCGNVAGNEARCTSCHAGYGWEDMSTPPPQESTAVDCLVCHDRSGQYAKLSTGAGHPPLGDVSPKAKTITGAAAWPVDLTKAARSVGLPGRENCGQCHFYGGGGDNVKHGDLSSALYEPALDVDVHMSSDGANMVCTDCHKQSGHQWAGSRYHLDAKDTIGTGKPGEQRQAATCESCHDTDPHPATLVGMKLNDHTDKLACQTCHIPEFARGGVATKTWWDWSTAGRLDADGKPVHEDDFVQSDGKHLHTYLSTKGDFRWEENAKPIYAWFDGDLDYTLPEETIDPTQTVNINAVQGTADGEDSRIWPFKRMEGRQSYDKGLNKLAYSHVWGPTTDTAFWTNFSWDKAIEAGMKAAGSEYSGEYGFIDTVMYWPITHMVAPAEDAMQCAECHADDGRMAGLAGIVMPGTDADGLIGRLGQLVVALAALGVAGHAALRIVGGRKGGH